MSLLAGALSAIGFAPYFIWPIPIICLIYLFWLWHTTPSAKACLTFGFYFGLGLYGAGIYWIYICLHDFGGMPWWFAGFCTFCLCAFMALFPALVGYFSKRIGWAMITAPVLWGLSDWIRSWIFTGFPWLTLGYSQVPHSPLIGFMPIIGVYGISVMAALIAAILAYWVTHNQQISAVFKRNAIASITLLLMLGGVFKCVEWTTPDEKPFSVALVQGNISQHIKWSPEYAQHTIDIYMHMLAKSKADLTILPETALPMLESQLSPTLKQAIVDNAKQHNSNTIIGMVQYNQEKDQYLNSALSYGSNATQTYAKNHLVPFGEFIPLKAVLGWVYRDWLNMPLSDLTRGGAHQTPMQLGNQQVAVNICYEDVFGEEVISQLPLATVLVNVSNDAWYGDSIAADQHMQFSQARAIETGRMVLRATNTGATGIIDTHGYLVAHAPHFKTIVLEGVAQGYKGVTPYVRWGNGLFLILSFGLLAWSLVRRFTLKHA
jgi:apolipoprotein N-acyltransferase